MRSPLIAALTVGSLLLAACGSDDAADSTADPAGPTAAPADTTAPAAVTTAPADTAAPAADGDGSGAAVDAIVSVAATDVGDALVGADGLTLYGFTPDSDGVPTCEDSCADAWPPLVVDTDAVPAGLDAAVFSVVERPDGSLQLAAGTWPLYFFAGDAAPGDVNGQGSGGVWFVAAPDGSLIGADE